LIAKWRRRGRELGFGAGIAQGYATLGQIGFAERSGYTAIGTVCNLAARLCAEAKDGQILVAQRVAVAVEETTVLEEMGVSPQRHHQRRRVAGDDAGALDPDQRTRPLRRSVAAAGAMASAAGVTRGRRLGRALFAA
jgi:hypothetical protein